MALIRFIALQLPLRHGEVHGVVQRPDQDRSAHCSKDGGTDLIVELRLNQSRKWQFGRWRNFENIKAQKPECKTLCWNIWLFISTYFWWIRIIWLLIENRSISNESAVLYKYPDVPHSSVAGGSLSNHLFLIYRWWYVRSGQCVFETEFAHK